MANALPIFVGHSREDNAYCHALVAVACLPGPGAERMMQQTPMKVVAKRWPTRPVVGGVRCMRAHVSQVKIVALCASLLAVLAPTLVGCGTCTVALAPPPHAVLTVENGVVYGVGDKRFAMRASDGKVLWQNAENPYFGPHGLITGANPRWAPVTPVVDGQTVIETMGVGLFMAMRATDGRMLWHSRPLTPSPYGALAPQPVVVDGVIYAAVGYGTIAAWDEGAGHTLWVSHFAPGAETAQPTNPTYSAGVPLPVVAGSTVYASAGRSVYALRVSDGSMLWHLPDASVDTSYSAPVVAANTVYVADSHGTVFALDPETGAIRWRSPGSSSTVIDTQPKVVVQGQTVFVASQGSLVRALNAATGAQLWRYQTHDGDAFIGGPLAPLVVEGDRVYLASLAFGLYVLDAATGRELWRATLDNRIFNSAGSLPDLSTPAVDQGMVALVAVNGIEAWRISDGQELWVAHIPDEEDPALAESAAVAAGMVYVAQGGTQSCGGNGKLPRVLALRDTDGTKRWQVSS